MYPVSGIWYPRSHIPHPVSRIPVRFLDSRFRGNDSVVMD